MKLFGIILFLFGIYCFADAGLWGSRPDKKTDCSSGTCIDYCNYPGANLKPGETHNPGDCSLIHCNSDFSYSGEK